MHPHEEYQDRGDLREHMEVDHLRPTDGIPDDLLGHMHFRLHRQRGVKVNQE